MSRTRLLAALALSALLTTTRRAEAQAWFYPAFQLPQTVEREYNFLAAAGGGSAFVFQWREGISPGNQLSLDAGLADPTGASNTKVVLGGQFAHELARATADQPLDLLITAGAGFAAGNGPSLIRIPIGVSVGHTFPLDGGLAVTPFVHPRVSFDTYSVGGNGHTNHLSLDFDVGGSLDITRDIALRAALRVSGNEGASSTGFGISLAVRPQALKPR